MMNKDEAKGKVKQLKGAVKQDIAVRRGDPALHDEGTGDRAEGELQESFGRGKRKIGEAIERVGRKVNR